MEPGPRLMSLYPELRVERREDGRRGLRRDSCQLPNRPDEKVLTSDPSIGFASHDPPEPLNRWTLTLGITAWSWPKAVRIIGSDIVCTYMGFLYSQKAESLIAEEPHNSFELKSEGPPLEPHADLCIRSIMFSNDESILISVPAERFPSRVSVRGCKYAYISLVPHSTLSCLVHVQYCVILFPLCTLSPFSYSSYIFPPHHAPFRFLRCGGTTGACYSSSCPCTGCCTSSKTSPHTTRCRNRSHYRSCCRFSQWSSQHWKSIISSSSSSLRSRGCSRCCGCRDP
jgi:hypothetical protein